MTPVDCGGCAPPVIVETERQRDQRVADERRAARAAAAEAPSSFCAAHGPMWAPDCAACHADLGELAEAFA